jgi:putative acetyltransferase
MPIRSYASSDYPSVLDIYALSKLDELRFEGRQFDLVPWEDDARRLAEFRESVIVVFAENGAVLAYIARHENKIRSLFVHPAHRGRGLGRQLLEYALARMCGPICLNVAKSNLPAQALYAQYGFVITEEFDASYNGVVVSAYQMVRRS